MGKYFKYAIGEIILVMIGILLALQVNNWNEVRITQTKNESIIKNLNNEFSENLLELQGDLERLSKSTKAMDTILKLMRVKDSDLTQQNFEALLEQTFTTPKWSPSSFVLEELKNSGALTQLNDNSLKKMLFRWERDFSKMKTSENDYNKYAEDYIEFITKYGSVRNLDALSGNIENLERSIIAENPLSFLSNPEFENRLDNFYFLATLLSNRYQNIGELMEDVISATNLEHRD